MKTLNFNQGCILGTSELIEYNQQLRDELRAFISEIGNSSIGILMNRYEDTLKVSQGANVGGYGTISIVRGGFCVTGLSESDITRDPILAGVDFNGIDPLRDLPEDISLYYKESITNVQIPGIGTLPNRTIRYVVNYPKLTVFEEGTCNISTTAQVVFTDDKIVSKLRSQITNSPSKITFFTDSSTKFRSGEIFEVMSIVNDTTIIISGDFTTSSSGLYCAIVGSYDVQELPNLVNKYLYAYYKGELSIMNDLTDTLGGVPLAKLTFATDQSFTIEDIRYKYRYNILPEEWISISSALASSSLFSTYINGAQPYSFLARSIGKGKLEIQGKFYPKAACVNASFAIDTSDAGLGTVVSPYKSISRICDIFSATDLENLIDLTIVAGTGKYVRVNNNITLGASLHITFKFGATVETDTPHYFSVETNSL